MKLKGATEISCPAKLNLGLRITGRAPSGLHLLQSLFWPIDFCDTLEVETGPHQALSVIWEEDAPMALGAIPTLPENTLGPVLFADTRIHLRKRIPMGAGMGGGSSNAGSLLGYWTREGRLSLSQARQKASEIGADVPFFLHPLPCWVEGTGEKLLPIRVAPALCDALTFLVVFFPRVKATREIFKEYSDLGRTPSPAVRAPQALIGVQDLKALTPFLQNDLLEVAGRRYPLLLDCLAELQQTQPLYCSMTGSGYSCFAIYENQGEARKAAQDLHSFLRYHQCESIYARTFRSDPM